MSKRSTTDTQLSFDFEIPDQKIKFIAVKAECRCGYSSEYKKADVVLEMTVPCPKCGSIISIR